MTSIGNGDPVVARKRGADVIRSVGEAEDALAAHGYDGIEFTTAADGRTIATSYTADGYRAQAIGRDRVLAARSLVTTITR